MKRILLFSLVCALVLVASASAQGVAEPFVVNPNAAPGGGSSSCSGFEAYEQPLDTNNFSTARTSDQETAFVVSEDIVDGGGAITTFNGATSGLRWWGINFDFIATFCTDDDDANTPFDLTFSADAGGTPGAVLATVSNVVPTIVDTGVPFASTTVREYTANFSDEDITGASWVTITRQVGVAGCNWLWVDETAVGTYDDIADQSGGSVPSDHTMCLAEMVIPVELMDVSVEK